MIGVGKLGQDCAEVMADYYDVVGYDVVPRNPAFTMKPTIQEAVEGRDIIFIAAPTAHDPIYGGETPTSHLPNKDFDYSIVTGILQEVNKYVTREQLVVLISTVLPGTVRSILEPCITNARFIYNPYLIAMGTTKWDMVNPEMVIIGTADGSITGDAEELIEFYKVFMENNPRYEVGTWDEAESIKIFYNTFISTKLALVNMVQDVAETNGNINVDVVTNALAKSTHRIMGPAYMKAGLGDAGACHPRDNIALRYLADRLDLGYDLFDSIMTAREVQAERMALRCLENGQNITIIGKSYKPGVPYTNGSVSLLTGHYIEKHGGNVKYYDHNTGDTDLLTEWTDVYLIGYWDTWVDNMSFPVWATVIDPWRKITPQQHNGGIIHYGNTRISTKLSTIEKESHRGTLSTFLSVFSELEPYREKIYITTFGPRVHQPVDYIVKDIRTAMQEGKTKIVFECASETIMTHFMIKLHKIINCLPEVDVKNIFYVAGAVDSYESYHLWADRMNITRRPHIMSFNMCERVTRNFHTIMKDVNNNSPETDIVYNIKPKRKKFVCFNKVHRGHRIHILAKMLNNGLIDRSYFSFEGGWPNWVDEIQHFDWDPMIPEEILKHRDRFPMKLNITQERPNPIDLHVDDIVYHDDSYFSIITETIYYKQESNRLGLCSSEDSMFLTEKIFKAILFKHPFIVAGMTGSLKALRDIGFKTFHPYIDESYDTEENDDERINLIVKEAERLCQFTDEQWLEWQSNVKDIVEHNFNVIMNRTESEYRFTKNAEQLFNN